MGQVVADRVKETTTTTGTGAVTLAGAVTGYRTFGSVMANADTCYYCIAGQSGSEWEVGLGTWNTGGTLTRTTVLASSNAGAAVNLSAGTKDVFLTQPADAIVSSYLRLKAVAADPTAPSAGELMIYTRPIAGRQVPRWIGPSGLDSAVQPTLWGNSVAMWLPGTGTTAAINFGVNWGTTGTQAHPAIADTNVMTRMKRATFTASTVSTAQAGVRSSAAVAIRNAGFFFAARIRNLNYVSTMQAYVGLSAASGALTGEPSAVNDLCALTKDSGETTWQATTRDTTAASKTSTGETTAAGGATNVYDFFAFCKPGDSKITVRMNDVAAGTTLLADTEKSSNLPTGATALYAHCECRSTVASSVPSLFLGKMYIEADI